VDQLSVPTVVRSVHCARGVKRLDDTIDFIAGKIGEGAAVCALRRGASGSDLEVPGRPNSAFDQMPDAAWGRWKTPDVMTRIVLE